MDLGTILGLTYVALIVYILLAYYGLCIRAWSAVALGVLLWLVLINVVYSIKNVITTKPQASLFIYIFSQVVAIFIIFLYVLTHASSDKRIACKSMMRA
jgi:hypothetical protein